MNPLVLAAIAAVGALGFVYGLIRDLFWHATTTSVVICGLGGAMLVGSYLALWMWVLGL